MKSVIYQSSKTEPQSGLFLFSACMFQMGLALISFEQVRPFFAIQVSDYCFFLSFLLFLPRAKSRLAESRGSGALLAGCLIFSGALLSLRNTSNLRDAVDPLVRLFILFGLFAPLAVAHSEQIRKNILFLIGGIFVNCGITLLQAWVFPGIVEMLSINPGESNFADIGRLQGLTSHPNTLGLSAALAVLLGIGLLSTRENREIRGRLIVAIFVCTVAALLSVSRTFLVALIPALIVFACFENLHRQAVVRIIVILIVSWGSLTYLAPGVLSEYSERLGSSGVDYSSDSARLITAAMTAVEISQKPVLGWGADYFGESANLLPGENGDVLGTEFTFLRYWYAAGLLGAVGFLALFVIPIRRMLQATKGNSSVDSRKVLPLALASYVLLFIASSLHPFFYNRYLYLPMFVFAGYTAHLLGPAEALPTTGHFVVANRPPGAVHPSS